MSIFEAKAQVVASGLVEKEAIADKEVVESGSFILIIIALFKELLPLLLSCLTTDKRSDPVAILAAAKSLGPLQRWMLRNKIRNVAGDSEGISMLAVPLDRQIRTMLAGCTEQDFSQAIAELS